MIDVILYPNAGVSSAAASFNSGAYDLVDLKTYSIQVIFSGGGSNLVGSLELQCSSNNTDWDTIPSSVKAIDVSVDATHTWDVVASGYRYVRVVWTYTSGTGNALINLHVKESVVRYA